MNLKKGSCLIAYFSHKGYNYVNGKIIDLKLGNTEVAVNKSKENIENWIKNL